MSELTKNTSLRRQQIIERIQQAKQRSSNHGKALIKEVPEVFNSEQGGKIGGFPPAEPSADDLLEEQLQRELMGTRPLSSEMDSMVDSKDLDAATGAVQQSTEVVDAVPLGAPAVSAGASSSRLLGDAPLGTGASDRGWSGGHMATRRSQDFEANLDGVPPFSNHGRSSSLATTHPQAKPASFTDPQRGQSPPNQRKHQNSNSCVDGSAKGPHSVNVRFKDGGPSFIPRRQTGSCAELQGRSQGDPDPPSANWTRGSGGAKVNCNKDSPTDPVEALKLHTGVQRLSSSHSLASGPAQSHAQDWLASGDLSAEEVGHGAVGMAEAGSVKQGTHPGDGPGLTQNGQQARSLKQSASRSMHDRTVSGQNTELPSASVKAQQLLAKEEQEGSIAKGTDHLHRLASKGGSRAPTEAGGPNSGPLYNPDEDVEEPYSGNPSEARAAPGGVAPAPLEQCFQPRDVLGLTPEQHVAAPHPGPQATPKEEVVPPAQKPASPPPPPPRPPAKKKKKGGGCCGGGGAESDDEPLPPPKRATPNPAEAAPSQQPPATTTQQAPDTAAASAAGAAKVDSAPDVPSPPASAVAGAAAGSVAGSAAAAIGAAPMPAGGEPMAATDGSVAGREASERGSGAHIAAGAPLSAGSKEGAGRGGVPMAPGVAAAAKETDDLGGAGSLAAGPHAHVPHHLGTDTDHGTESDASGPAAPTTELSHPRGLQSGTPSRHPSSRHRTDGSGIGSRISHPTDVSSPALGVSPRVTSHGGRDSMKDPLRGLDNPAGNTSSSRLQTNAASAATAALNASHGTTGSRIHAAPSSAGNQHLGHGSVHSSMEGGSLGVPPSNNFGAGASGSPHNNGHIRDPTHQLPDASVLAEMPLDMMLQQLQDVLLVPPSTVVSDSAIAATSFNANVVPAPDNGGMGRPMSARMPGSSSHSSPGGPLGVVVESGSVQRGSSTAKTRNKSPAPMSSGRYFGGFGEPPPLPGKKRHYSQVSSFMRNSCPSPNWRQGVHSRSCDNLALLRASVSKSLALSPRSVSRWGGSPSPKVGTAMSLVDAASPERASKVSPRSRNSMRSFSTPRPLSSLPPGTVGSKQRAAAQAAKNSLTSLGGSTYLPLAPASAGKSTPAKKRGSPSKPANNLTVMGRGLGSKGPKAKPTPTPALKDRQPSSHASVPVAFNPLTPSAARQHPSSHIVNLSPATLQSLTSTPSPPETLRPDDAGVAAVVRLQGKPEAVPPAPITTRFSLSDAPIAAGADRYGGLSNGAKQGCSQLEEHAVSSLRLSSLLTPPDSTEPQQVEVGSPEHDTGLSPAASASISELRARIGAVQDSNAAEGHARPATQGGEMDEEGEDLGEAYGDAGGVRKEQVSSRAGSVRHLQQYQELLSKGGSMREVRQQPKKALNMAGSMREVRPQQQGKDLLKKEGSLKYAQQHLQQQQQGKKLLGKEGSMKQPQQTPVLSPQASIACSPAAAASTQAEPAGAVEPAESLEISFTKPSGVVLEGLHGKLAGGDDGGQQQPLVSVSNMAPASSAAALPGVTTEGAGETPSSQQAHAPSSTDSPWLGEAASAAEAMKGPQEGGAKEGEQQPQQQEQEGTASRQLTPQSSKILRAPSAGEQQTFEDPLRPPVPGTPSTLTSRVQMLKAALQPLAHSGPTDWSNATLTNWEKVLEEVEAILAQEDGELTSEVATAVARAMAVGKGEGVRVRNMEGTAGDEAGGAHVLGGAGANSGGGSPDRVGDDGGVRSSLGGRSSGGDRIAARRQEVIRDRAAGVLHLLERTKAAAAEAAAENEEAGVGVRGELYYYDEGGHGTAAKAAGGATAPAAVVSQASPGSAASGAVAAADRVSPTCISVGAPAAVVDKDLVQDSGDVHKDGRQEEGERKSAQQSKPPVAQHAALSSTSSRNSSGGIVRMGSFERLSAAQVGRVSDMSGGLGVHRQSSSASVGNEAVGAAEQPMPQQQQQQLQAQMLPRPASQQQQEAQPSLPQEQQQEQQSPAGKEAGSSPQPATTHTSTSPGSRSMRQSSSSMPGSSIKSRIPTPPPPAHSSFSLGAASFREASPSMPTSTREATPPQQQHHHHQGRKQQPTTKPAPQPTASPTLAAATTSASKSLGSQGSATSTPTSSQHTSRAQARMPAAEHQAILQTAPLGAQRAAGAQKTPGLEGSSHNEAGGSELQTPQLQSKAQQPAPAPAADAAAMVGQAKQDSISGMDFLGQWGGEAGGEIEEEEGFGIY